MKRRGKPHLPSTKASSPQTNPFRQIRGYVKTGCSQCFPNYPPQKRNILRSKKKGSLFPPPPLFGVPENIGRLRPQKKRKAPLRVNCECRAPSSPLPPAKKNNNNQNDLRTKTKNRKTLRAPENAGRLRSKQKKKKPFERPPPPGSPPPGAPAPRSAAPGRRGGTGAPQPPRSSGRSFRLVFVYLFFLSFFFFGGGGERVFLCVFLLGGEPLKWLGGPSEYQESVLLIAKNMALFCLFFPG